MESLFFEAKFFGNFERHNQRQVILGRRKDIGTSLLGVPLLMIRIREVVHHIFLKPISIYVLFGLILKLLYFE
jgi:hypothetical protein